MNLVALVTHLTPDINVITFEIMGSHLHVIGEGSVIAAEQWFSELRKRLYRYFHSTGRVRNLDSFQANIIPIDNLQFLRNSIAYVNRNGYLVHPECTPFSYAWGANRYFFNPDAKLRKDLFFSDLNYDAKRNLFRSNTIDYPASHCIVDGYISPACFCDLNLGERIFRDARHPRSPRGKNTPFCPSQPKKHVARGKMILFCPWQPLPRSIYRNIRCDKYCSKAGLYASETWMRAPPMEMS